MFWNSLYNYFTIGFLLDPVYFMLAFKIFLL